MNGKTERVLMTLIDVANPKAAPLQPHQIGFIIKISAIFSRYCRFSDTLCSKEEFITAVTSAGGFGVTHSDEQYRNFVARAVNGQIQPSESWLCFWLMSSTSQLVLTTKEEWGPPVPGTYPNTVGVPGKNYHGRGYIQLTW
ncbi:hypothetical protein BV898_10769 [Hypsibius exemplaris]|uniref:Glycoside hydrolase family 19 catalytic domain-containing protein n=1 Tax=Hypsibius exemplaris TaxID=2072580 RepID=A0A1W0WIK2_HYPEX|nr:hypothetical protein BV898_10769 [Hypsibius exemplaris]